MKVLVTTRNLPPLVGGMERLLEKAIIELRKEFEVLVVGPEGCSKYVDNAQEVPYRPLSRFLLSSMIVTTKLARESHPDVILAGSGLTVPIALAAAKASGAKSAAYFHGLDVTVDSLVYSALWKPLFKKLDLAVANSSFTKRKLEELGVDSKIVHPGASLKEVPAEKERPKVPRILYVGRLTRRKGLLDFLEHFPEVLKEVNAELHVIGPLPEGLLKSNLTMEEIEERAKGLPVKFLGKASEEELVSPYLTSDVLIFPVRDSETDPEGFGMVAIEAASFGLPVVAFASGGVVDAVKDGLSGKLVKPGDWQSFVQETVRFLKERQRTRGREFAEQFEWSKFGEKLRSLLSGLA